jgi:glutamate synthase (NADPH/NADH) large chain
MQQRMLNLTVRRFGSLETINRRLALSSIMPGSKQEYSPVESSSVKALPSSQIKLDNRLAAFGWGREDLEWIQDLAATGSDPISSLGYDGPLAPLSRERQNISDYFKEAVAVVTNPAIDREREVEHFSTQTILGARPPLVPGELGQEITFTFDAPILLEDGASSSMDILGSNAIGSLPTINRLLQQFPQDRVTHIQTVTLANETTPQALERIAQRAVDAARSGSRLLVLDDADAFLEEHGWVDPILVLGVVDRALRLSFIENSQITSPTPIPLGDNGKIDLGLVASNPLINLRRQVGVVMRSGAIRNLHDLIMCIGMGADAVVPYLIFESVQSKTGLTIEGQLDRQQKTLKALRTGIEKCISTMGIHESRGYGRLFASIGISSEIASALRTTNYAGSDHGGLSWEDLDQDNLARRSAFNSEGRGNLS